MGIKGFNSIEAETSFKAPFFLVICFPVEKLSLNLKCITRWEGTGGVTITIFFQHTDKRTRPALNKKTPQ